MGACWQNPVVPFELSDIPRTRPRSIQVELTDGRRAWLPRDHIDVTPGVVWLPVWLARKVFANHETKGDAMDQDRIENNFTYHPPRGDQPERYEKIRENAKWLAQLINQLCPESREKSLAMNHIETAVMWANAAIARNK